MDENAVIEAICQHLGSSGYMVTQRLTTKQHGIDVVAHHSTGRPVVYVEAKGGTSSREGSTRFGKPYDSSQVFDVVSKGIFSCLSLRAKYPNVEAARVVLAVPGVAAFREKLSPVQPLLQASRIEVWYAPANAQPGA